MTFRRSFSQIRQSLTSLWRTMVEQYVGFTAKQPEERLEEHNLGSNKWTRSNKPFKLVYQESFVDKTEAIKREKFLKSGQGRKYLDSIIPA